MFTRDQYEAQEKKRLELKEWPKYEKMIDRELKEQGGARIDGFQISEVLFNKIKAEYEAAGWKVKRETGGYNDDNEYNQVLVQ